jgi:lysophospholipid acyltransferase (LPLAT)-like uncharacterized protein
MSDGFSRSQRLVLFIASILGPALIYLIGMTWRVRVENPEKVLEARKVKGQILYCFWHCNLFVLCYTHRSSHAGLMISQSFDGEIVSRILQRLGYKIFRGSTSRSGAVALLKMLKDQSCDLALTVDGPRGPAEKVKPGAVTLAAHSGMPIIPISIVASRAWRMKSWDRLIIPKPFSIVTIKHGDLIMVERRPDNTDQIAETIENGIKRLC